MWWMLMVGCGVEGQVDPSDTSVPGSSGTPTGSTETPFTEIVASCEVTDNVLRYACQVEVDPPQQISVSFSKTEDGSGLQTVSSSEEVAVHDVELWFMAPNTEYAWQAYSMDGSGALASGTFTTSSLPAGAQLQFTVEGQATFEHMLFTSPCMADAVVVIVSTEGEVLYYQDFADGTDPTDPLLDGVKWTEDDTLLAIKSGDVLERDLTGELLFRVSNPENYTERVHHDSSRWNGWTYALFAEGVTVGTEVYEMDGFYVFDLDGNVVDTWHLQDFHMPAEGPVATLFRDYSHANAIWLDEDGNALLSFRHLSSIMSVVADPGSPDFGLVNWVLGGDPLDARLPADMSLTAVADLSPSFVRQHNPQILPDGRLSLFDNRLDISESSRIVILDIMPEYGVAVIEEAYTLPDHCNFQGAAIPMEDGSWVATCAPYRRAFQFDAGATEPRWSLTTECATAVSTYVPRMQPFELPER